MEDISPLNIRNVQNLLHSSLEDLCPKSTPATRAFCHLKEHVVNEMRDASCSFLGGQFLLSSTTTTTTTHTLNKTKECRRWQMMMREKEKYNGRPSLPMGLISSTVGGSSWHEELPPVVRKDWTKRTVQGALIAAQEHTHPKSMEARMLRNKNRAELPLRSEVCIWGGETEGLTAA